MFIYGFRFTMIGLSDGHTPSQPAFPTGWEHVFVLCQLKKGIRIMIAFLLAMGSQCWDPIPLCRPTAAPFLGRLVSLWISLFLLVNCFTTATSSSLVVARLAFLETSCSSTFFLLVAAAVRLLKYPSSDLRPTSSPPSSVFIRTRTQSAALAAPNLSAPSDACSLTCAFVCAFF